MVAGNRTGAGSKVGHAEVLRVWRENHCLKESSVNHYLRWVTRFRAYCHQNGLEEKTYLTLSGVCEFAKNYARTRGIDAETAVENARSALRAWSLAVDTVDGAVTTWEQPSHSERPLSPLLSEFAEFLRQHRGSPPATIKKKLDHIEGFVRFLRSRRRPLRRTKLADIDAFVVDCRSRYARTTVADICSSVRGFLRFLHSTQRIAVDLAPSVVAPVVRRGERPMRFLPWNAVRQILRVIDRSSASGQRDYAMLLLMSTYGLGAGETINLTLDDVDWRNATLRVVRPKTGVEVLLPLLPAVARVLVTYLRRSRPAHVQTRHLFVSTRAPHLPLSASGAVRHILMKHARAAGVSAPYLGSHVLRHSHACRQMEHGTRPKVIGDILGHRRPESTSAYIRISTDRLRELALPVPE